MGMHDARRTNLGLKSVVWDRISVFESAMSSVEVFVLTWVSGLMGEEGGGMGLNTPTKGGPDTF